jgi:hypothetical protein
MKHSVLALMATLAAAPALAADASAVAYPEAYRSWDHVKSMVINKGHPLYDAVGGIHSVYANPSAIKGYKAGKRFADGSVIVFDLFEAVDKDNAVSEGDRKAVIVMAKDSKKYGDTNGWGYQVFDPKTKKGTIDATAASDCHACHTQVKDQDYVFSAWRP